MALLSYALTTVAKVKARLPNVAASGLDSLIESLINQATDYIEKFCTRRFLKTAYVEEKYDGDNEDGDVSRTLILNQYPVDEAATFKIEYRTSRENDTWSEIDTDTYDLNAEAGIVYYDSHFPAGKRNIRVTYTAGYLIDFPNETTSTHTLPFDLTEACETLAVREFKRRDDIGLSAKTISEDQITFLNKIDAKIATTLAKYQRIEFY